MGFDTTPTLAGPLEGWVEATLVYTRDIQEIRVKQVAENNLEADVRGL